MSGAAARPKRGQTPTGSTARSKGSATGEAKKDSVAGASEPAPKTYNKQATEAAPNAGTTTSEDKPAETTSSFKAGAAAGETGEQQGGAPASHGAGAVNKKKGVAKEVKIPERARLVLYQGESEYKICSILNEYEIEQQQTSDKIFQLSAEWWLAVALEVDGEIVRFQNNETCHITIVDMRDPFEGTKRLYHSISTAPWKSDGLHYFAAIDWLQRGTYKVFFDIGGVMRKDFQLAGEDFRVEPLIFKVRVEDPNYYDLQARAALIALPETLALVVPGMRRRLAYPKAKLTKAEK
jgi:hypothetical protein